MDLITFLRDGDLKSLRDLSYFYKEINMNSMNFEEIIKMQKDLWQVNKDKWAPMDPEHGKTFILYMIEEIGEVISIIKKKGEEKIMTETDIRERFIEEMSDVLMYFTDVLNRFDISAEEFSSIYIKKHKKNMGRNFIEDHKNS